MKRRMYPLAAPGYRCFSAMIEKPIKSHSSFKRIISMAKLKALKESVEKLLLYAKTISIRIFKEARCIVFQALRTIWFFVTGLVWEYLRHLKKGFEDQVSQYHFLTFVAIISTFMVCMIDRFDLSSYLGFLFKDAKECPIDVLAKEVREMEIKLNEQSELSQQDRQTFIKLANEVQMAISELAGLKVRADRFDTCIEELYSELRKLKDEKKEK